MLLQVRPELCASTPTVSALLDGCTSYSERAHRHGGPTGLHRRGKIRRGDHARNFIDVDSVDSLQARAYEIDAMETAMKSAQYVLRHFLPLRART